jgi:predicted transport protein
MESRIGGKEMLFKDENSNLVTVKEKPFKLEKDIQSVVEKNLRSIFELEFVESEFSIDNYRFDTVAFNKDSNSFVIIEYKRGKNESLVDQGYAYLYTLLNRKADFVLLISEKFNKSYSLKDIDWSQTRIMFVSPKFTDYQKNATSFTNMAFKLYEIQRYSNDILVINEINNKKSFKANQEPFDSQDSSKKKVDREIIIYTEEIHTMKSTEPIIQLYEELKSRILDVGDIKVEPKKLYIAFKGKTNICDLVFYKKNIKVYLNLKEGKIKDPENLTEMVANVGTWGNGDYRFTLNNEDSLDYLMMLIIQSYRVNQ